MDELDKILNNVKQPSISSNFEDRLMQNIADVPQYKKPTNWLSSIFNHNFMRVSTGFASIALIITILGFNDNNDIESLHEEIELYSYAVEEFNLSQTELILEYQDENQEIDEYINLLTNS